MSRPVVPRMARAVSESFKNAVERSGAAASAAPPGSASGVGPTIRRRPGWERWRARLLRWTRRIARGTR